MSKPLFRKIKTISKDDVIEKMKYFISEAEYAMEFYRADDSHMLQLTRELKEELKEEHRYNSLLRTEKRYADHTLFTGYYQPAIHEALVSVTGQLNADKAYRFLDDVKDYMQHYLPEDTN